MFLLGILHLSKVLKLLLSEIRWCFGVDLYDFNEVHLIKTHCRVGFASKGLRRCWLFQKLAGTAEQGRKDRFHSVVSHR